jgi:hypothetical protein
VKPVSPAPQRAGKRAPPRAPRGRKAAAGKKAPPAPKPRRKGIEIVDLEAVPACEDPPKVVAGPKVAAAAKNNLALNKVAEVGVNKGLKMDDESAEKIVGVEDEPAATPVPERVLLSLLNFVSMDCHLPSSFFLVFYLFAPHLIT